MLEVGDPLTLTCIDEDGRDIIWSVNSSRFGTADNSDIVNFSSENATHSELRISAARLGDAGYYTCQPVDDAQVLIRANVTVNDRTGKAHTRMTSHIVYQITNK